MISQQPIIALHDASIYQDELLVLSNVNLQIGLGDFVYLIGKTGSGKSSLLKTLYADIPMKKGQGSISGFDLAKLKRKEVPMLRRKLGIVFQDFQLLTDRTVYENLVFVLNVTGWKERSVIEQRIDAVLKDVDLHTKAHKMPHQLSGGEQQRVAIARALLNEPEIILADEPTGNLDPETSLGIMKLLKQISEGGKAVVMATHNYTLMDSFPGRVLKCEQGTLIQDID